MATTLKAEVVPHHSKPLCGAPLTEDGLCSRCGVVPDGDSTTLRYYCPSCSRLLELEGSMRCPKCGKTYET